MKLCKFNVFFSLILFIAAHPKNTERFKHHNNKIIKTKK